MLAGGLRRQPQRADDDATGCDTSRCVDNGQLAGIVSIGDVVKTRMEALQAEREQLEAYITQG